MINIDCHVGLVNAGLQLPPALFDTGAQALIGNVFQQASGNDFQLTMHPSQQLPNAVAPNVPATALDLHVRLAYLVGAPTHGPVSRIGLLLAHSYENFSGALGVMFDRGKPTLDDPYASHTYTAVARQGCAVFLGTINGFRTNDEHRAFEARFTTLHELGHVFNLPHTSRRTLMSMSPQLEPLTYPSTRFDAHQCQWLSQCSTSASVAPGGSDFGAGSLDPYAHFDLGGATRVAPHKRDLRLRINMEPRELLPWQPAELELSVHVKKGGAGRYRIPEMLDPAYGCFSIFVEDPRGERRLYRPTLRQCPHGQRIAIAPGTSFRRDINISRQQGEPTFRHFGIHRIHVEFRLSKSTCLRSNTLEISIRKPRSSEREQEALGDRRIASLLKYKQDLADEVGISRLREYCGDRRPRSWSDAYAQLALGSALLQRPAGSNRARTNEELQLGGAFISRALDSGKLTGLKERSAQRKLGSV